LKLEAGNQTLEAGSQKRKTSFQYLASTPASQAVYLPVSSFQ